jgi:hypothetical protein
MGWSIDEVSMMLIDRILSDNVRDPVGPEFMAPPLRAAAGTGSLELATPQAV